MSRSSEPLQSGGGWSGSLERFMVKAFTCLLVVCAMILGFIIFVTTVVLELR